MINAVTVTAQQLQFGTVQKYCLSLCTNRLFNAVRTDEGVARSIGDNWLSYSTQAIIKGSSYYYEQGIEIISALRLALKYFKS